MPIPVITTARTVTTPRLATRVLFSGPEDGVPVVFVHGNLSAATWWEETMLRLPGGFRAIAPDLRSYGESDPAVIVDATRGMKDFSDDLAALMDTLGIRRAHFVGHSLGGGVLWQFLADHPALVMSLTQVCPSSPYGFGGSKADGSACFADGAGAGAGGVNAEFAKLLAAGDRGDSSPVHPRNILNTYVWKPPFVPSRIEDILTAALSQQCGEAAYPGDAVASPNWPTVAPGTNGPINAMARLYQVDPEAFLHVAPKPPILWIRGADDPIVSDTSLFDVGYLGQLGAVPGWPGADVFPAQPMVSQTSALLDRYEAQGGVVKRVVFADCGHSPYLEQPDEFDVVFHAILSEQAG